LRLDVFFTPKEPAPADLSGRTVVVIDVLRATTTMLAALCNGAREILPVASVEEAVRKKDGLGRRDDLLLCGERGSRPIPGFDLGNSPLEFTAEKVRGRTLVMTTTNGTPALLAGAAGMTCYVACLRNAGAAADAVAKISADTVILCAGRHGRYAMEDALCAGLLAHRIRRAADGVRMNDAGRTSLLLAKRFHKAIESVLPRTAGGRHLTRAGYAADIRFCAAIDAEAILPRFHERRVTM
jgi:2-phosphosulfolactate phosphatase